MSTNNKASYDKTATDRAKEYQSMQTPDILPEFCKAVSELKDKTRKTALDIGCGTGRDAAWLADRGLTVTAADNSKKMLENARELNPSDEITYILDEAPGMDRIRESGEKFDVILMGAFLFHLDENERQEFYNNLRSMASDQCLIYATLREGPIPEGRNMYHVPLEELENFAKSVGGKFIDHGATPDALERPGVSFPHLTIELS